MFQSLDVFRTAISMARHAGQAQALSAQNIANADTPRYRAKEMPDFASTLRNPSSAPRATRAGHVIASFGNTAAPQDRSTVQDPNGNTVSLELEMVRAVDADRQHGRALAIYKSGLSVLRASLGRS